MRDAECDKLLDGDLQPRVAGIRMVGVDFHLQRGGLGAGNLPLREPQSCV